MTLLPKDRVLDALAGEFTALDALLHELPADDWAKPSLLPGWDVRANVAHIIGTESALAGLQPPDSDLDPASLAHVRNDIGASNERWVHAFRDASPEELTERLRSISSDRLDVLRAMDQAAWDTEGFTPAGPDTYGRFMRIRVFDTWMHEQDIRDATDRPGHLGGPQVELTLDEMATGMGYVVGKKAGVPKGSSVTFDLTGASGRAIHVEVVERAAVVAQLAGPATVTLRMPVGTYTRLGGGRVAAADVADQVEVIGDAALGRAVLDNLGYTI